VTPYDEAAELRAAARSAAYQLFARLFRSEPTADLLPLLRDLPELGSALPDPLDPDEAAAEHHRLFGLQVPPFAGLFLDHEGRIGGAPASVVRDLYSSAGLELEERSEEADHVSHTLDLLAAVGDDRALAAETLDRALLPWLPWMVEALERLGGPFHRTLAGLAPELALDHRRSLAVAPFPPVETPLEDPLADAAAGLRHIASYLVTPARSGLYLAREDVRRLGAGSSLPSGFGGRADSLETLLRAAAELGGFSEVLEGIGALVRSGREACDALARSEAAGTEAIAAARRARLGRTSDVLARLIEGAGANA
jgi:TorA maturation chaperone TorD